MTKASLIGSALLCASTLSTAATDSFTVREITCADAAEVPALAGKLVNNMWNKQAVREQRYQQCLLARHEGQTEQYGWSWSWPPSSKAVLAFPQVVFGWKPWDGGTSTTAKLPIRIDAIRSMRLSYDIETAATGQYILSAALWFTRTGSTGVKPNPQDISADLNIWTEVAGFSPSGTRIATVTIDGSEFELWHQAGMGDASGANANRWQHIVYRATRSRRSATLDIRKFVELAVKHEVLSPTHLLSSIELGNEVMAGEGQSWIKNLSLSIE